LGIRLTGVEIMAQTTNNQTTNNPIYTIAGVFIGAVLALAFAKTGNPGLIGVGAVLGMVLGTALQRRFNKK
jgi:outer membrane lipoprotein SlyB